MVVTYVRTDVRTYLKVGVAARELQKNKGERKNGKVSLYKYGLAVTNNCFIVVQTKAKTIAQHIL